MSENLSFNITGWKVWIIIPVIIIILILRIASIDDMKSNARLVEELKLHLMSEYYPDQIEKMKALLESGKDEELSESVDSVTTAKINFKSIKGSDKIFHFSTKAREVVIKVNYSIDDADGAIKIDEKYYRFEHKPLINGWRYIGTSSAIFYYLNFI